MALPKLKEGLITLPSAVNDVQTVNYISCYFLPSLYWPASYSSYHLYVDSLDNSYRKRAAYAGQSIVSFLSIQTIPAFNLAILLLSS
jgi:hypothetical protein